VSEGDPVSAEQLVAERHKAKVDEFLVHTCSLLASLGYGKLTSEPRELEQARLAIEALKALAPLLPEDAARDMKALVSSLQLAYAEAAAG
jgi:hypothetical protein